ncbi:MAG: hypothetical protein H6817_12085, partial [Phycisphaerales bacterium]|nr:hypothetical protein [Phycisphaerales bacterium]
MAIRTTILVGSFLSPLLCSAIQAASPHLSYVSQERRVWAKTSWTFEGVPGTETQETLTDDNFGLFDQRAVTRSGELASSDGFSEMSAGAYATHDSQFTSRRMIASLYASGSAYVMGGGGHGETDALSELTVVFDIDTNALIRLDGGVQSDSDFGGPCIFHLTGPSGFTTIDVAVQGSGQSFLGWEPIVAPAGRYTLYGQAFADTEQTGGISYQYSEIYFELAVIHCGTPEEPFVVHDVSYALHRTPNSWIDNLYRNFEIDRYQDWSQLGEHAYRNDGGLAADPISNKLYAVEGVNASPTSTQFLRRIIPGTGGYITTGPTIWVSVPSAIRDTGLLDIAFRADGTMYGIWGYDSSGMLGTVDVNTGGVTFVGDFAAYDPTYGAALAFDPVSDLLYNAAGSSLYEIDLGTQSVTPIALTSAPIMRSLAFHPTTGVLYAGLDDGTTAEIDLAAGKVTGMPSAGTLPSAVTGFTFLRELTLV